MFLSLFFFGKCGDVGAISKSSLGFWKMFWRLWGHFDLQSLGDPGVQVYTSPLHLAARNGRAEAARLLLDLGADKDYSSNMQDGPRVVLVVLVHFPKDFCKIWETQVTMGVPKMHGLSGESSPFQWMKNGVPPISGKLHIRLSYENGLTCDDLG